MSESVTVRKALFRLAMCLVGLLVAVLVVGVIASIADDPEKSDPATPEPAPSTVAQTTRQPEPSTTAPTGALGEGVKSDSTPTPHRQATRHSKPEPTPTHTPSPADVYYPNCTAVRSAGAAPLYRGEPGYASHLDRDGDGVACET